MTFVAEPEALESDTPLGPVNADDLKRVWSLIRDLTSHHGAGVGIGADLIAEQCGPGTDAMAVFFRAALVQYLFDSGLLNDWREGDQPSALVFQVGAGLPLEHGVQGFDPAGFIERLRSEKP